MRGVTPAGQGERSLVSAALARAYAGHGVGPDWRCYACNQAGATQSMQRLLLKSLAPLLDAPARPHRPLFSGSLAEGPKIIEDVSSNDLHRGFEEASWVEVSDPRLDGRVIIALRSIGRRSHG